MKIEMKNISMEFPGVKALSNVDFEIETGEIRAIVGANGAGKSTLMKVLAGANPGYTGEIFIDGELVNFSNPIAAKNHGIEIVYQEVDMALFLHQSVAENIMMNNMITGMGKKNIINWDFINSEAKKTLDRMHIDINVKKHVIDLSLAEKQMVLIARAVYEKCNFLILDEPTAPLSSVETEKLFDIVNSLVKETNMAVMFISHRLNEILEICENITVMKDGRIVDALPVTKELTISDIVCRMLGANFNEAFPKQVAEIGDIEFEVEGLTDDENKIKDVSFYARAGEIIGICGLVGAGKTELCKALFAEKKVVSGKIKLHGKVLKQKDPSEAVKNKIALVPEERRKEGVMVDQTVAVNLAAACLGNFTKYSFVNKKAVDKNAEHFVKNLGIKTPSINQYVRYLSGGNQQKVAVGKWIAADGFVYIFDEPTKGVDVGAKQDIFKLIQDVAHTGKCAIYATSELTEILTITDRLYVMYDGKIVKEMITKDATEEEIMYYSTGGQ